jgi:ferredoxin
MSGEIRKHPLNVQGKYYFDQNWCNWCLTCIDTAPNNFKLDEAEQHNYELGAYIFKQPETPEEEDLCQEAVMSCPHEAILDNGL